MKKSEKRKELLENLARQEVIGREHLVEFVLKEIEDFAADLDRQAFDPEEEPLPERISGGDPSIPGRREIYPEGHLWASDSQRARGYAEAARRYNAWPKLRALIAHHLSTGGGPETCGQLSTSLLAILDGKDTQ